MLGDTDADGLPAKRTTTSSTSCVGSTDGLGLGLSDELGEELGLGLSLGDTEGDTLGLALGDTLGLALPPVLYSMWSLGARELS
jgi:hypothetical protein